jgi:class 3 adenylate cyclase/HAMP domain-containing protein
MTIRKRLTLGFLAILALFAVNQAGMFYSDWIRISTVEELRAALDRQLSISHVKQRLKDLQNEVGLSGQIFGAEHAIGEGLSVEEILKFESQLDLTKQEIRTIRSLTDPDKTGLLREFEETFDELATSWLVLYRNYGVDQVKAITEQVMTADPLNQKLISDLLPKLEEQESRGTDAARDNYYRVSQRTKWLALLGVAISVLVGTLVAYTTSRHLVRGLDELKLGAARIGEGRLEERIAVRANDELGELAHAFNEMGENLLGAQQELTRANVELEEESKKVEEQRQLSESLLRNILPEEVAAELHAKGEVEPHYFEDVTVLFADISGFTLSTEKLAAEELVLLLNDYFTAFDEITTRYGLEKLKTIGDCYMCVGGCPRRTSSHPVDMVLAAFEMLHAVAERDRPGAPANWKVRIGVHSGPVIAGVVGTTKFAFDIWGDTVNYASRMESSGAPGRINLSHRTFTRVKDFFACESRGKVLTKEKRQVEMFFANGILPGLLDAEETIPPPAFVRRYRVYFNEDPPSFPGFDPNLVAVENASFLRQASLFASLDAQALRRVAEIAKEVVLPAGSAVFAAGEAGDSGYLIKDGKVRIHLGEVELRILEQPAYFGEMSLLSDQTRSASVTAVTECRLLRIDKEEFRQILLLYPQAALDIIRNLSVYLVELEAARRRDA